MVDPTTSEALKHAMSAARAGNVGGARQAAENALVAGGDRVALNAFLGMLMAKSGDGAAAIRHLRIAHRGRPTDATIACNLIAALIDAGDLAAAMDVATLDLATADPSLRVARYRGFLAQSLERFEDAVKSYEHVLERAPGDFESWNNLGNAHAALGDHEKSILALERAIALQPDAPPTRLNLAAALSAAGRAGEAEVLLRNTIADFPEDSRAWHELYVLLKTQNRQDEALAAIEQAIERDSGNASLRLKLGIEYGLVSRIAEAEVAFREAIARDPLLADAYLGLAVQYEHTNREDEFAPLIALGGAYGLDEGTLAFIRALECRRAGRIEEGLRELALVPASVEPERAAYLHASLLDRLGRSDEAFAAFAQANTLHASDASDPLERAAKYREDIRAEIATLTPDWVASWRTGLPRSIRPDPVFLVGFPRSGTTLLDTFLMGHPHTAVMEERPPLNHVDEALGGMMALPNLDPDAAGAARDRYFREVDAITTLPADHVLIDKSPLFLQKVPLIQRLFPKARFILALRHPCDVLLSCLMSNFRLNTAMSNFLRLPDAAEFYDLIFRHWKAASALFPVNVHTIVYERLVDDPSAELRPLFDFLGLDWHDAALDHTKTAKARGLITTASYSQVAEPIYKRAAGRWQRYRKHLEPVFPVLQRWVEKFGYSL